MSHPLMRSVSGVRGIVGEGITPEVLQRYSAAYAGILGPGPIVFGRDSRPSGAALRHAVLAGLLGAGREVLEIGIVPTPTVQLSVERHHAAGGIALTASHNPVEWNALKFIGPSGRFLAGPEVAALFEAVDAGKVPAEPASPLGASRTVHDAVDHHVDLILGLDEVNREAIGKSRLRVIVDAVHGAGGPIARMLLRRLDLDHTILFEETSGRFPRTPEPLAEHLGVLCEEVKKQGADIGLAFDPDVDRLSLVDETGRAIGEECSLPLAADHVLGIRPGPVVTNLSTSARIEAVAARHGQTVTRTPVGEANVVAGILETGARIGGEGNGGVILPGLHLGRDAPAGAAVILSGLAERGIPLSRWAGTLPDLHMIKTKLDLSRDPRWEAVERTLAPLMPGAEADRRDGFRMAGPKDWVHLRKSGTEPVLRIIAEAPSPERARELIEAAEGALA